MGMQSATDARTVDRQGSAWGWPLLAVGLAVLEIFVDTQVRHLIWFGAIGAVATVAGCWLILPALTRLVESATPERARSFAGGALLTGVLLLAGCVFVYASALSRVTGVLVAPFGIFVLGVGFWSRTTGRLPSRWLWLVGAVMLLALVVLGVMSVYYGATHPPMTA
jgi:hypothetical protein